MVSHMKKFLLILIVSAGCYGSAVAQLYETGVITASQPDNTVWQEVALENTYTQPVVITGPVTIVGSEPVGVRVRNITPTSFEYQLEEFTINDPGEHGSESFGYLVIEAGRYTINGATWEAGSTTGNTDGTARPVTLLSSFDTPPVILTQLASNADPVTAIPRVDNVTVGQFDLVIGEGRSHDQLRTAADQIHYLAVQSGSGSLPTDGRSYEAGVTAAIMDETSRSVSFATSVTQPLLLARAQTINGGDPFFPRYSKLYDQGVNIQLDEEDLDPHPAPESMGYLVLEGLPSGKQLLWVEDFNLPEGTTSDNALTAWTTNTTALGTDGDNYFEVRSERLLAQKTGGEVIWTSEAIPIAGYNNVKVAVDILGEGVMENNDHVRIYYKLNGGAETPLINGLWLNSFSNATAMAGGLSGNQLEIIVKVQNSAADEVYYVDNVQVFTEPDDRYAIQDGDWSDPATWSYTPGGPSCLCIPDQLSNTHIDGYTVNITAESHTRNLTVYNSSKLRWAANDIALVFYGNATLDVKNGGMVDNESTTSTNVFFVQWNNQNPDNFPRVGGGRSGVEVLINVDDPDGLRTRELSLNAIGNYVIQGTGNIYLSEALDLNFATEVTNNLQGEFRVSQHIELSNPNATLINNGNIVVSRNIQYEATDTHIINNGNLSANNLIAPAGTSFRNQAGSVLKVSGSVDPNLPLFADVDANEIHYDGAADQIIATPQDAYWHLYLSNKNASGSTQSTKEPASSPLEIHGDLIMTGTAEGTVTFDVDATNTNINVAGDWWQYESDIYAVQYIEGGETVTFNGSTDQQIGIRETYYNVVLDKPSGQLLLDEGIQINGRATFTQGIASVGADTALIMGSYATVEQASDASHVVGKMHKYGNRNFTYPLGDGTSYRPISVSSINFIGDEADKPYLRFTAQYHNDALPQASTKPDSIVSLGPCGYWELERTDDKIGSVDALVTLSWDNSTCPVDVSKLAIARWDGTQWVSEGRGTIVGDATSGSITTSVPLSDFGLFTLAEITDVPVANDDVATTDEDTPVNIDVSANDTDDDGINPSSVTITQPPQHGTASVDPATGIVTYTPELNYFSETTPDSLTYVVEDTRGVPSLEGKVKISVAPVNDAPQAANDEATTFFATALEGAVLDNDSDIEGDHINASLATAPNHGTVDLRTDGTYTYVPNATFSGTDQFTYQVCDEGTPSACTTATVTVTVRPFNHAPRAQKDTFTVEEDNPLAGNVLLNDTDINPEDTLTVEIPPVILPRHGSVTLQPDGSFTYVPGINFFGTDSLAYQVCDNGGPALCDTAWLMVYVVPVNDRPVAVADTFHTTENQQVSAQVLANDYDTEDDTFYGVTLVSSPSHGELTLQADGSFLYTPQGSFVGEDKFTYQVCDAQDSALCNQTTATILVQAGVLTVPKGFSPNNDHTNDQWIIEGIRDYPNNQIKIFNRWGNVVYQASGYNNITVVWGGEATHGITFGNGQLPDGTYFYVIDLGNAQKPLSGYLILKR